MDLKLNCKLILFDRIILKLFLLSQQFGWLRPMPTSGSYQKGKSTTNCINISRYLDLPAYKITDDIGMANKYFITILFLFWTCAMEVLPKRSFYACPIFEELLKFIRFPPRIKKYFLKIKFLTDSSEVCFLCGVGKVCKDVIP